MLRTSKEPRHYGRDDFAKLDELLPHVSHIVAEIGQLPFSQLFAALRFLDSYYFHKVPPRPESPGEPMDPSNQLSLAVLQGLEREALRPPNFGLLAQSIAMLQSPPYRRKLSQILNKAVRRNAEKLLQEGHFFGYISLISASIEPKTVQTVLHVLHAQPPESLWSCSRLDAAASIRTIDGPFTEGGEMVENFTKEKVENFVLSKRNFRLPGILKKCFEALGARDVNKTLVLDTERILSSEIYPEDVPRVRQALLEARHSITRSLKLDPVKVESVVQLIRVETLLYLMGAQSSNAPVEDKSSATAMDMDRLVGLYFEAINTGYFRCADLAAVLKYLLVTKSRFDVSAWLEKLDLISSGMGCVSSEEHAALAQFKGTRFAQLAEAFLRNGRPENTAGPDVPTDAENAASLLLGVAERLRQAGGSEKIGAVVEEAAAAVQGIKAGDLADKSCHLGAVRLLKQLENMQFELKWSKREIPGVAALMLSLAGLVSEFEAIRPLPETDPVPRALVRMLARKYPPLCANSMHFTR